MLIAHPGRIELKCIMPRFEQMILQYDDEELGGLEEKGIRGDREIDEANVALGAFVESQGLEGLEEQVTAPRVAMLDDRDTEVIEITRKLHHSNKAVAGG